MFVASNSYHRDPLDSINRLKMLNFIIDSTLVSNYRQIYFFFCSFCIRLVILFHFFYLSYFFFFVRLLDFCILLLFFLLYCLLYISFNILHFLRWIDFMKRLLRIDLLCSKEPRRGGLIAVWCMVVF